MQSKKRERSANFHVSEVQLLISLVTKHKQIIENKKTDAVSNKDKEAAWKKIEDCFNSYGISTTARSWKTLKLKYESMKKMTKKKSSLQRQEMYRTGGGPSKAPEFDDVDEKVISICSNITGLEARHDSDTISESVPVVEVLDNALESKVDVEVMQKSPLPPSLPGTHDDNNSPKENIWNKWHPKVLKTRVSNVLKPTKSSVTSKLDKLSEARLELVQLQMENASREKQFMEEEHKLKMVHLANDERRKEEIHALLMEKNCCKCRLVPNDIL